MGNCRAVGRERQKERSGYRPGIFRLPGFRKYNPLVDKILFFCKIWKWGSKGKNGDYSFPIRGSVFQLNKKKKRVKLSLEVEATKEADQLRRVREGHRGLSQLKKFLVLGGEWL